MNSFFLKTLVGVMLVGKCSTALLAAPKIVDDAIDASKEMGHDVKEAAQDTYKGVKDTLKDKKATGFLTFHPPAREVVKKALIEGKDALTVDGVEYKISHDTLGYEFTKDDTLTFSHLTAGSNYFEDIKKPLTRFEIIDLVYLTPNRSKVLLRANLGSHVRKCKVTGETRTSPPLTDMNISTHYHHTDPENLRVKCEKVDY